MAGVMSSLYRDKQSLLTNNDLPVDILELDGASEKTKEFIKEKGLDVTEAQFNVAYDHWTAGAIFLFLFFGLAGILVVRSNCESLTDCISLSLP